MEIKATPLEDITAVTVAGRVDSTTADSLTTRLGELSGDRAAQALRREHLHVRTELQDLHHQLARVRVRHLEQVAAVRFVPRALVGMPALRRDPARGLRREAKAGPLDLAAGEDPVAAAEVRIELRGRNFLRARLA